MYHPRRIPVKRPAVSVRAQVRLVGLRRRTVGNCLRTPQASSGTLALWRLLGSRRMNDPPTRPLIAIDHGRAGNRPVFLVLLSCPLIVGPEFPYASLFGGWAGHIVVTGAHYRNTSDEAGGREPDQCTHTKEPSPSNHSILPFLFLVQK